MPSVLKLAREVRKRLVEAEDLCCQPLQQPVFTVACRFFLALFSSEGKWLCGGENNAQEVGKRR